MPAAPHTNKRRDHNPVSAKNLVVVMLLNLVITLAKTGGSFLSGSLALLSDALQNLSIAFATFNAYTAILAGKKENSPARASTFRMAAVLAAMINAVIAIVLTVFLLGEAYDRLYDMRPVRAHLMIVVGMIGLLSSIYAAGILKNDTRKSSRVRANYTHQVFNGLSSAVVIAGGILVYLYQIYWIDPVITGLISLFLLRSVLVLLFQSARGSTRSLPDQTDLSRIKSSLEQFPEVRNVRHIHAWAHGDRAVHLEAHLELGKDLKISELGPTRSGIEDLIKQDIRIQHVTLQFGYRTNHVPKNNQEE